MTMIRRNACAVAVGLLLVHAVTVSVAVAVADDAATLENPAAQTAANAADQKELFESRVRPLLSARCYKCHGEKKQEAGLRLDSRAALLAGSENGPVVALGQPEKSKLVHAIRYGGEVEMPPDGKLPREDIEALTRWIAAGAVWPTAEPPSKSLTGDALYEYARKNHWALRPIRLPVLPTPHAQGWTRTPLDAYVLSRLEAAGMVPSPAADRASLIRRVTFDLLGLPPTADEVDAFVADPSPDAYERLVDRLLAAPQYGERWGRHWLDVARYSDTRGYAFGRERRFPYAYTYRDYVIRAFNGDVPFDRFVHEQLAADRLALNDDKRPLAALGFLTVGRRFDNPPDDIDDRIDVVTRGLLGLTVGCARCHDHKFDPIASEDYYSLYGVFASSVEPREAPVIGMPAETAAFDTYHKQSADLKKQMDDFSAARYAEIVDAARRRVGDYLLAVAVMGLDKSAETLADLSLGPTELKPRLVDRWRRFVARRAQPDDAEFGPWQRLMALAEANFSADALRLVSEFKDAAQFNPRVRRALAADPPKTKTDVARIYGRLLVDIYQHIGEANPPPDVAALRQVFVADGTPTSIPRDELRAFLDRSQANQFEELQKKIDRHQINSPGAPPRPMMLVDAPQPYEPYVFVRGNQFRHGKQVPRQFLKVVAGPDRKPFSSGSGRLELAQAITAADNPLTARVIVNRVWMHHFGQPLVVTPSDFGLRTPPPSHPELLDDLAWRLREQGWSLKWLHREILLSATYRQASLHRPACAAVDPENRLLWRANRRRLEFEPLRDALLAVSGRLEATLGGRPVDVLAQPFTGRRTVYGLVDRQDLPNLLRVFDFASPDQTTPQRPQTTVPQQALFLLNSPFVAEQARQLASRCDSGWFDDSARRINALYRLVYSRAATAAEVELATTFLRSADEATAWSQLAQALLVANEFTFID